MRSNCTGKRGVGYCHTVIKQLKGLYSYLPLTNFKLTYSHSLTALPINEIVQTSHIFIVCHFLFISVVLRLPFEPAVCRLPFAFAVCIYSLYIIKK